MATQRPAYPVNVHDFIDKELGKVIPYGIYDMVAMPSWVNVGIDHDTAAFAVATFRTWWTTPGSGLSRRARLLITADGGGSNGSRTRLWKTSLPPSPQKPACSQRLPFARRAHPNGTRLSTGRSPTSP